MKKFNKLLSILSILITTSLIFTSCVTKKSTEDLVKYSSKKYRIGFAMSTFDDNWLGNLMNAAKKEAKNLSDADVIFVNAKNDATKQKSQIMNLIAQKCNVIIVISVDTDKSAEYTQLANDSNVPIISVNRFLKNQNDAASYVGSDSITAGIMQGEYVVKQLNGKGNVVLLRGEDTQEAAIKRTEGVKQVFKNYPDIKIVAEDTGKWQRTLGMQITENWIKNDIKFDAVVCNNDEMAIGAIMALKEFKKLDNVLVAGTDATPDALKFMKEGSLKVTVFQNAEGQGSTAIDTAYKIAKGEKVNKNVFIPYELVVPNDADKYLQKQNAK
ncbi:sugar ABC transporter substrate-binding protein [Clostridium sp. P21]|uniref:Sugar ABC transporter substrate-binding protein n=1 Tax=Clostridium muellerianum TaxID=2716538 RepID=A0A7Y0EIW8_9CLOT|nr:sugar ABC transporter substrate-binding protein [Clostridium muellerianum]NMM64299.1 sugar ABC transporter substrate-binding protein [Clostridium muellerianum]